MAKVMFVTKGGEYFPPMGLMQISAIAKQRGHETYLCINSRDDAFKRVEEVQPEVIAYTGSTGEHKMYFELNRSLKARFPDITTIMGGPHATFFPEGSLKDSELDAVCIGEGDYAFPDFLDGVDKKNIENIPNIMTKKSISRPPLRSLVQNLDSLPFSDRALFYDSGESGNNPIKHFFVSRGCPFSCTYCFNKPFREMYSKQKYLRKRSVDSILEEISKVREKWPLKYIKFYDDVFALKADDWLREFADKYPKEIGLPFFCLTRSECLDKDMADLLQQAGCKAMSMSIESANERIRKDVLRRNMSNEQIKNAYRLCGERGIAVQSNNILALPTSTIEDDIATLDFNIECGPKQGTKVIGEFGTAHPYPGTELYSFCERNGFYDSHEGFNDMHMSYQDSSPLNCFSEQEKRMQRNLTMLGTVAVRFPSLRNLIVNHLIKLPTNPAYFAAFYLTKTSQYMRDVYPIDYSLKDYLRVLPQSLKLDWFKRMRGKKWKKI